MAWIEPAPALLKARIVERQLTSISVAMAATNGDSLDYIPLLNKFNETNDNLNRLLSKLEE